MCVQDFSRPVQCSEDVPEQPPSFQTGQEVSVASGSVLSTPNLQTDAERVDQSRPSHGTSSRGATGGGGDAAAGGAQDVITIKGKSIGCLTTFFFQDRIWKHAAGEWDPCACITIKGKSIGCLTTFFFQDRIWKHAAGERDPYAWCHWHCGLPQRLPTDSSASIQFSRNLITKYVYNICSSYCDHWHGSSLSLHYHPELILCSWWGVKIQGLPDWFLSTEAAIHWNLFRLLKGYLITRVSLHGPQLTHEAVLHDRLFRLLKGYLITRVNLHWPELTPEAAVHCRLFRLLKGYLITRVSLHWQELTPEAAVHCTLFRLLKGYLITRVSLHWQELTPEAAVHCSLFTLLKSYLSMRVSLH